MSKNPSRMTYYSIYDPTDDSMFEVSGRYLLKWKYLYPVVQESIPSHMLKSLGPFLFIKDWV